LGQVQPLDSSVESQTGGISRDTIYKILSNTRRRYVIHHLQYTQESVELGPLAERVAAWEYDTDPQRVSSQQRKAVYTALQQRHLPRMDEAGLLGFDPRAGTVTPREELDMLDIYTEVVPEGDFPWSQYYLGLSIITTSLLVAVWAGVPYLSALPGIAWGVFCVIAFMMSAIAHVVLTQDMKLGIHEQPPEVEPRERGPNQER
jgi:hypothetical protein